MADIQDRIQKLLSALVRDKKECGIQVAAYYKGRLVVDAWAGLADAKSGKAVDARTLFPVFSTTKGITATVIHLLAERGKLGYEDRISGHWPEFAENGKQDITVRQALNHSAGIPQMPDGIGLREVCDWRTMCAAVAKLKPLWTPGSQQEYHAITYGWILGELAHRVDGRPFAKIVNEEICRPLGIVDLYVGAPDEVGPRVAVLYEPDAATIMPNNAGAAAIPLWIQPLHEWMNRADARRSCVPASSGVMSARAVARHYAALVPGGVDGVELLPPARVKVATVLQNPAGLKEEELPMRIALGYLVGGPQSVLGKRASAFGHDGYGGSMGFADPERGFACGLTKNLFSKNGAQAHVVGEIRKALGIL